MSSINNIVIKKVWQDTDFLEVRISCSSENISATANVYLTNENLMMLHHGLIKFCNKEIDLFKWQSGDLGDDSTACVSFLFSRMDKAGHIAIDVFMEIDDGAPFSKHNCCFYVFTEIGLLYSFVEKLGEQEDCSLVSS